VFVFARAPRLGTVKRRLARDIGDRAALRFYAAMLRRTVRMLARDRRFLTVLAVTPDHARARWPGGVARVPQGRGDLGQRMHRVANRQRRGRVVIVGTDIPAMTADDVLQAFRMLGRAQACFGTASDGGYWLVGMSPRRPSRPFGTVRWSSEFALADTLANFAGYAVAMLRELRDVDTVADLNAASEFLPPTPALPLKGGGRRNCTLPP
jgi:rSAM/selenodomain-associated transferase 1